MQTLGLKGGLLNPPPPPNLEFQLSSEFSEAGQDHSNTIRVNWVDQPNVATNPFIRR